MYVWHIYSSCMVKGGGQRLTAATSRCPLVQLRQGRGCIGFRQLLISAVSWRKGAPFISSKLLSARPPKITFSPASMCTLAPKYGTEASTASSDSPRLLR